MKQLEIPFELKKEENKCIFGGYCGYKGEDWITLDDSKTIKERKKHVFVFNHERCEMFCNGDGKKYLKNDSIDLKPTPKAYLTLASFLKEKGYRFNKKLSIFEEKPYRFRVFPISFGKIPKCVIRACFLQNKPISLQ